MEIDEITSFKSSPKVLSENEIQRLELKRLRGTAKTTERVEHIKQALESLDNDSDTKIKPNQHISAIHPNHSHLFNSPKDIDNPVSQVSKLRPMSAQSRRQSLPFNSNLGVIPENKTLIHRNIDNNVETDITIEDIDDICSSSHDPRYPPNNIFNSIHDVGSGWIPTGLVPQILYITFHLRWLVRKIEITCTGVEEISINIMSGARIAPNIHKFKKTANDKFLFESLSDGNTDQTSNENAAGVVGKKIFVIFSKANTQFFKVTEMKIRAIYRP
jgi:hypothetical protein